MEIHEFTSILQILTQYYRDHFSLLIFHICNYFFHQWETCFPLHLTYLLISPLKCKQTNVNKLPSSPHTHIDSSITPLGLWLSCAEPFPHIDVLSSSPCLDSYTLLWVTHTCEALLTLFSFWRPMPGLSSTWSPSLPCAGPDSPPRRCPSCSATPNTGLMIELFIKGQKEEEQLRSIFPLENAFCIV